MSKFFKLPMIYDNVRMTSPFGWRTHPITGVKNSFHQGIDLARTPNTNVEVCATADGEVIRVGKLGTYGNIVMIKHDYKGKRMDSNYAHLKDNSIVVKVGQKVKQGQKLAIMGTTGSSTAPHLHFEIHDGAWKTGQPNAVDPMKYISMDDWKVKNEGELTMTQYNELKKLIETQNSKIKTLENKLEEKENKALISDTPSTSHKDAWEWGTKNGLVNGKDTKSHLNREQFMTVLMRFYNKFVK